MLGEILGRRAGDAWTELLPVRPEPRAASLGVRRTADEEGVGPALEDSFCAFMRGLGEGIAVVGSLIAAGGRERMGV